ncbi:hypothetical protein DPEC_G00121930 [Dallia pectoralis]|uniref:Uncharacterized protein n=1 Tax=Dallia pectoralis TaxID=75939 RepID=A0ACC2GQU3_DALPE|nr:hypothetical protein DPEC_G00121930 [Dallia pectoralis]
MGGEELYQLGNVMNITLMLFIGQFVRNEILLNSVWKMENTEGAESFNPLEASCSPMSSLTTAPLDFSQLTPSKLGISTQSFIPSNIKEKSRLAQLKLKRRSSVGVRGSPETNSLIRYIAQQRMKTPPSNALSTLASPFSTQGPSTLKQKMAIFQNIMDVVEDETTHQSSPTVGRIPTRDVLSAGGWSCDGGVAGKENKTPVSQLLTPPPSKRRCTADSLGLCAEEIREANPPDLKHTGTSQKMHNELAIGQNNQHQRDLTPGAPPQNELCGVVDHAPRIDAVSRITHGEPQPSSPLKEHRTPTKEEQDQGHSFELHSPSQTLDVCSGPDTTTLALLFPMPSHLEIKPTDEADSSGDIVNSVVKRKQVRFGIPLPPELFDKNLPPSTPLQKGGTPARVPTSAGGSQLRSLLKTPQRTPLGQPDFCSPSLTGASPTLTVKPCLGEPETANTFVQITFPSLEDEVDCSFTNHAELHAQPLDLNSAFQEEDTVCEAPPSAESLLDPVSALGPEPAPVTTTPARSSSRKRKLLEEKEPVKRSTRMAAKSACGRMKNAGKRGFGKKAVDRSLYGKRDYASKNPGLSPITEALSLPVQSNVCCRHTANQHSCLEDVINDVPVTGEVVAVFCTPTPDDIPATDPSYGPSVDCCVPAGCSTVSGPGRATRSGRRRSGPTKPTRTNKQSVVRACRRGRGQEAASYVEPIPNRGKPNVNAQSPWLSRGRRSHLYASALPEENEEEQTFQSGSPKAQMEIDSTFPSWAQDFNIDDVLQPLPSRGRKSVRRSLRNLSQNGSLDPSRSGLAWLPHNSPDSIKTERRKTRSRRSSIQAALHLVEWDHMTL